MQYLLTKEEYDLLCKRAEKGDAVPSTEELQALCTLVANKVPLEGGTPWYCILTTNEEHYCDLCPAKNQCPNPDKEWSK